MGADFPPNVNASLISQEINFNDIERLLETADRYDSKIEKWVFIKFTISIISIIYVATEIYSTLQGLVNNGFTYLDSILSGIIIFVFPVFTLLLLRSTEKKKRYDQLALREALTFLHEIAPEVERQHGLTIIQKAEFRIRLSRYEIPPEKSSSIFD
jgi:hypothetical protein